MLNANHSSSSMNFTKAILPLLLISALSAKAADAGSLLGDKDGFGIGILPDQGFNWSLVHGPAEAASTDSWIGSSNSWIQTYDISSLGALTSASITVMAGGLGYGELASLYIDNVFVGTLSDGDGVGPAYNYAKLDTFDLLPFAAKLTGSNTFTIKAASGDGWALDYSELKFSGSGEASVPDAGSTGLMLATILLGGLSLRRRLRF